MNRLSFRDEIDYIQLAQSMDYNCSSVKVDDFSTAFDFDVVGAFDRYFDFGNQPAGVVAAPQSKVFYHGSLYLNFFCPTFVGPAAQCFAYLVSPQMGLLSVASNLFAVRADAAAFNTIDYQNQHMFENVIVSNLRMTNVSAQTFRLEGMFTGKRITVQ